MTRLIAVNRNAMMPRLPERSWVATAVSYGRIPGCFYDGDDPLQLIWQIPDLLAFEIEPREAFLPLADIDPYVCNLRLRAISAGDRDEIAYIFRLVPDQVYIVGIPPGSLPAVGDTTSDNSALIRKVIEAQCEVLRVANRGSDFAGCAGSAARVAMNALRRGNYLELADNVARAGALSLAQRDAGPLLATLEQTFSDFAAEQSPVIDAGGGQPDATIANATERQAERLLRVGEAKVEALVNLAGELVVAKNALAHTAKRVEEEFGDNDIARSINATGTLSIGW